MKQILFTLLVALFIIAACAPATLQPVVTDEPAATQPGGVTPSPTDSKLLRGNVYLDSIELLTMESYPLQFTLMLEGNLPTPCHELKVTVSAPDAENKIIVDVYSLTSPDVICVQMLEPFVENFPLGSFPAGHYTLWVNGEQVSEFDS